MFNINGVKRQNELGWSTSIIGQIIGTKQILTEEYTWLKTTIQSANPNIKTYLNTKDTYKYSYIAFHGLLKLDEDEVNNLVTEFRSILSETRAIEASVKIEHETLDAIVLSYVFDFSNDFWIEYNLVLNTMEPLDYL